MELRWLEDFCALARTRHFSRAADEQNVTQPTLSRRIKLLEDEMGVMLIDRNTLPLSLTPAGKLFLESAEQVIKLMRDTRQRCQAQQEEEARKLRLASTQTLYLSFCRDWVRELGDDLDISFDLRSTSWSGNDFVQALEGGECDLILCYWHPDIDYLQVLDSDAFEFLRLAQDSLAPFTGLNRRGEPKFQLPGSDAQPLPYITYNSRSFLSPVISNHLRRLHKQPHLLVVNENTQAISVKAMIGQGFGIGWLPQSLVQEDERERLLPAGDSEWTLPLELRLYRLRQNRHPQMTECWQRASRYTLTQSLETS
ncbi:LysR family transcriptional regulator [Motiliproteus sediminis]|uniref:LysR family transcriptional regulator n=1 Tax=Motiliproteus sediminis TaxID=1468178 RepID=UPI001AEF4E67|nr:LysR family transcriptional regulator [Motiliproteus sediminis]